jgi:cell division protein FtsB
VSEWQDPPDEDQAQFAAHFSRQVEALQRQTEILEQRTVALERQVRAAEVQAEAVVEIAKSLKTLIEACC